MNTHAYTLDPVLLSVHEIGNFSTEMGGKKGRNNKGATDNNESSKDQQIAELTKQNKELNKKIDRLLELLAKEKQQAEQRPVQSARDAFRRRKDLGNCH